MYCETCKWYDVTIMHRCSCPKMKYGYGHDRKEDKPDEVVVEDDEGWGMCPGPKFGCIHHSIVSEHLDVKVTDHVIEYPGTNSGKSFTFGAGLSEEENKKGMNEFTEACNNLGLNRKRTKRDDETAMNAVADACRDLGFYSKENK